MRHTKRKAFLILPLLLGIFLLFSLPLFSTIYYVKNGGDDGKDGLSDANAWATIAKVNGSSFNAGDSVLFKRGSLWREQLTIPSSGASGNRIIFGAYGSGAKPIINGADLFDAGWVVASDTKTATITADADDQYYNYGNDSINDLNFMEIGRYDATYYYDAGWIFSNLAVPKDAIITNAYITFTAKSNLSADTVRVKIAGENDANPSSFVDKADFNTRKTNLTTAQADWDFTTDWVASSTYNTIDISSIIDEITSLVGWSSGNNLTIFLLEDSADNGAHRQAHGRGGGNTTNLAVLTVQYNISNVWKKTGVTTQVDQVFFDNTKGNKQASVANVDSDKDWYYDSGADILYVYSVGDPATTYTNPGVEATQRNQAIWTNGKNYWIIENIHTTKTNRDTIYLEYGGLGCFIQNCECTWGDQHGILAIDNATTSSNYFTIQNNTIHDNASIGIHLDGNLVGAGDGCDYNLIQNNTIYGHALGGVGFEDGASHNTVKNNIIRDNTTASGIYVDNTNNAPDANIFENNTIYNNKHGVCLYQKGTNHIIRYNNIYSNAGFGIVFDGAGTGNQAYYNICRDNDAGAWGGGVYISGTNSTVVYNNICENNHIGFETEGTCNPVTFKNNICADNQNEEIKISAGTTITSDYNCLHPEAVGFINFQGTAYDTLVAYQAGKSQDLNSTKDDPVFTDQVGHNFTLQPSSPCIDTGTDVGLSEDYEGNTVPQGAGVDIGAYEYSSLGIIAIDTSGWIYFVKEDQILRAIGRMLIMKDGRILIRIK